MKRYRFRLAQVLRVREVQEQLSVAALAGANRALDEATARTEARRQTYLGIEPVRGPVSANGFLAHRSAEERAASALVSALGRHRDATLVVNDRRADRISANQRTSALEHLDTRQRDDHWRDVLREEVAVADEQTMNRRFQKGAS